jgi:two-component system sensor histidine kinase BaeS
MFGSLRFRLAALFLLGMLLAGLVASLISIRFFQSYTRARAIDELRAESVGIVQLYARQAGGATVPVASLSGALGRDRIFWVEAFRGATLLQGLEMLPRKAVDIDVRTLRKPATVEITWKGVQYLAVAQPLRLGNKLFGALVVAKPESQLRSRSVTLIGRLGIALGGGVIVAGLLGLYLSRRITDPLRALSKAADEVAAGHYGVELPPARGSDEISHLSSRFSDMAAKLAESEQLSRNFLMSVSHELRTPLTAIRGHVAALREGVVNDPESIDASLEIVAGEAERLGRLVGDVLDLAKLDARRFTVLREEVDMGRLLDQAYASFGEEARRRGSTTGSTCGRPVIVTDGDRVLHLTLLSNAFRWTPEGGRVELSAENGSVAVTVADNGRITAEERERIFRPFWSRDGGGTGLGLAIARELAVALGGRIELVSEPGLGSRFVLVLPSSWGEPG